MCVPSSNTEIGHCSKPHTLKSCRPASDTLTQACKQPQKLQQP